MTVTDAGLAEAVAERADRRRHRLSAWLRRRHRRRRPVDRLDRAEITRAAADLAKMGHV